MKGKILVLMSLITAILFSTNSIQAQTVENSLKETYYVSFGYGSNAPCEEDKQNSILTYFQGRGGAGGSIVENDELVSDSNPIIYDIRLIDTSYIINSVEYKVTEFTQHDSPENKAAVGETGFKVSYNFCELTNDVLTTEQVSKLTEIADSINLLRDEQEELKNTHFDQDTGSFDTEENAEKSKAIYTEINELYNKASLYIASFSNMRLSFVNTYGTVSTVDVNITGPSDSTELIFVTELPTDSKVEEFNKLIEDSKVYLSHKNEYTTNSYSVFEKAYNEALEVQALLNGRTTLDDRIDAASLNLTAAINGLEKKSNPNEENETSKPEIVKPEDTTNNKNKTPNTSVQNNVINYIIFIGVSSLLILFVSKKRRTDY